MRIGTKNQIELVLIRHGSTASNQQGRYLGWTEEPLSKEGIEALFMQKQKGVYTKGNLLFTSPMERCRQTASILFPGQDMLVLDEWKEMDFGRFEGKTYRELNGNPDYQAWIDSNGRLPFPEGESREAFVTRSMEGLKKCWRICEEHMIPGQMIRASAVVHGGTIMAIISSLTNQEYFDFQVKNGQGYCLLFENRELKRFHKR